MATLRTARFWIVDPAFVDAMVALGADDGVDDDVTALAVMWFVCRWTADDDPSERRPP